MKKPLLVLCLALTTGLLLPSVASAKTPTLKSLAKTVAALQKTVKAQAATIGSLSSTLTTAKKAVTSQGTTIATLSGKLTADEATIAAQAATLASHTTTLTNAAPLLAIAPYVSLNAAAINGVAGPNIVFQGANVQVRSSTGEGDSTGLGNLIVGWDDLPTGTLPSPFRSGSNNLVVGLANNFTSYGGFVAGSYNKVSGTYANVSGGEGNIASGSEASVSGGSYNHATGTASSVSGGYLNFANGDFSSVGGGYWNYATGNYSSVSGGYGNQATSRGATIAGGNTINLNSTTNFAWQAGPSYLWQ